MKHIFLLANLLIVALAVYVGADAYRKVAQTGTGLRTAVAVNRPEKTVKPVPAAKPFEAYAAVKDRNLFNTGAEPETQPKPEPPSKPLEALKQTELNVKLWGTVTGPDGATYAVIEEGRNKDQNLYKEGDTVETALIKSIRRERVVLTVNGNDEVLEIEKMEGKGSARRVARAPRPVQRQPVSVPPQNIILKRTDLTEALQDSDKLMKDVRIRPHFTDGRPDGLMLTGIRPRSIFRKMGLRNGDIILGVDENDMRSVDDALRFYQNLETTSQTTLQIKRRGRLKTINYTVR